MDKFKPGDAVEYNGHTGVVRSTSVPNKDDGGKLGALIEWDNDKLIPPTMVVPYHTLKHVSTQKLPAGNMNKPFNVGEDPWTYSKEYSKLDSETNCPQCGSEWKETWIQHQPYYDCVKCNEKKEDILAKPKAELKHEVEDIEYIGFGGFDWKGYYGAEEAD